MDARLRKRLAYHGSAQPVPVPVPLVSVPEAKPDLLEASLGALQMTNKIIEIQEKSNDEMLEKLRLHYEDQRKALEEENQHLQQQKMEVENQLESSKTEHIQQTIKQNEKKLKTLKKQQLIDAKAERYAALSKGLSPNVGKTV